MSKQKMADAPVLKWFSAASDADLNYIYKRRNMHSNKTHGKEIYKTLEFSVKNEFNTSMFCL